MIFKNQILKVNDFIAERPRLQYYLPQALTLFFIVFVIGYFSFNAGVNMEDQGMTTGFSFLGAEAQFDIQFHLIDYHGGMTYGRAYLVGLLNTILVAVLGIFFCNNFRCNYWCCTTFEEFFSFKNCGVVCRNV